MNHLHDGWQQKRTLGRLSVHLATIGSPIIWLPFTEREKVLPIAGTIRRFADARELVTISLFRHTLPWDWMLETGTTLHKDKHAYRTLADCVARQIAGAIFVLGRWSGLFLVSDFWRSRTLNLLICDKKGKFSLLVRVEIEVSSLNQPVMKIRYFQAALAGLKSA